MTHDRLIRFSTLKEMTGFSRSSIERLVASGKLPVPVIRVINPGDVSFVMVRWLPVSAAVS